MYRTQAADARPLPVWRRDRFRPSGTADAMADADVILFADTFNAAFEPDNLRPAQTVLERAGFRVARDAAPDTGRPLCCGRAPDQHFRFRFLALCRTVAIATHLVCIHKLCYNDICRRNKAEIGRH